MYTMLMDERRSASRDRFIFTGVIVRTADLGVIRDELRVAATAYAGNASEELKYVPDALSAQASWCAANHLTPHDAKQAVLACMLARPKPEATVIVGIVTDPRTTRSRITDAEVYGWGYEMALQRFGKFLMGQADRGAGGPNEVIVDTLASEPHRFHDIYTTAYEDGWTWLSSLIRPLKLLNAREMLLSSVARYAPSLWLPDHVGGAVDDWIKIELQVDAAAAGTGDGPRVGLMEGARRRVAQLIPNFRDTAPGYSIAGWPANSVARTNLATWLRRLRHQAQADAAATAVPQSSPAGPRSASRGASSGSPGPARSRATRPTDFRRMDAPSHGRSR